MFDAHELIVRQLTTIDGVQEFSIHYSRHDEERGVMATNQECLGISCRELLRTNLFIVFGYKLIVHILEPLDRK